MTNSQLITSLTGDYPTDMFGGDWKNTVEAHTVCLDCDSDDGVHLCGECDQELTEEECHEHGALCERCEFCLHL